MSVKKAERLVKQWAGAFGFGDYAWQVTPLPAHRAAPDGTGEHLVWGLSYFHHAERWFEIQFCPDDALPDEVREFLVLHELAHGLFEQAKEEGTPLEAACNRVARLLLGQAAVGPSQWAIGVYPAAVWGGAAHGMALPTCGYSFTNPGTLPDYVLALPEPYRTVIASLFWDDMSLREVGRAMGRSHTTIRRWRETAIETLRKEAECQVD